MATKSKKFKPFIKQGNIVCSRVIKLDGGREVILTQREKSFTMTGTNPKGSASMAVTPEAMHALFSMYVAAIVADDPKAPNLSVTFKIGRCGTNKAMICTVVGPEPVLAQVAATSAKKKRNESKKDTQ